VVGRLTLSPCTRPLFKQPSKIPWIQIQCLPKEIHSTPRVHPDRWVCIVHMCAGDKGDGKGTCAFCKVLDLKIVRVQKRIYRQKITELLSCFTVAWTSCAAARFEGRAPAFWMARCFNRSSLSSLMRSFDRSWRSGSFAASSLISLSLRRSPSGRS
jgi:hypothetical protein